MVLSARQHKVRRLEGGSGGNLGGAERLRGGLGSGLGATERPNAVGSALGRHCRRSLLDSPHRLLRVLKCDPRLTQLDPWCREPVRGAGALMTSATPVVVVVERCLLVVERSVVGGGGGGGGDTADSRPAVAAKELYDQTHRAMQAIRIRPGPLPHWEAQGFNCIREGLGTTCSSSTSPLLWQ